MTGTQAKEPACACRGTEKSEKKRDCLRESAAAAGFCLPSGSTANRKIRYKYTEKQKNLFTIWKRCVNMYPVEVGAFALKAGPIFTG